MIFTKHKWILDGHQPVLCEDLMAWALWFETADTQVARTYLPGGAYVSTVFLAVDHDLAACARDTEHVPLLFETRVFGGPQDGCSERVGTWEEAEAAHAAMVARASAR